MATSGEKRFGVIYQGITIKFSGISFIPPQSTKFLTLFHNFADLIHTFFQLLEFEECRLERA